MMKAVGHAYAEWGRIKVVDTRNHAPVAQVEYSCEPMVPGDTLIPFVEKAHVTLRESGRLDRFLPANGKTMGRLVMARDFDTFLGMGAKVYVNVGSNQGVKVGDYFRAVRPYWLDRDDEVDSISLSASVVEDTQKNPPSLEPALFGKTGKGPVIHMADYPRRAVGEMVVLATQLVFKDGSHRTIEQPRDSDADYGFGDASTRAVKTWRYRPATLDGRPVDVYFTVVVDFALDLPRSHSSP
jgi:hypothetical protein